MNVKEPRMYQLLLKMKHDSIKKIFFGWRQVIGGVALEEPEAEGWGMLVVTYEERSRPKPVAEAEQIASLESACGHIVL